LPLRFSSVKTGFFQKILSSAKTEFAPAAPLYEYHKLTAMITSFLTFLLGLSPTTWIAFAALIVSFASLWFSILNYRRESPRLKIEAWRCNSDQVDDTLGYIEVKVVNVGRRPIYLVMLWGRNSSGVGSGKYLDYGGTGIKLTEHEFKTFRITHIPRGADQYEAGGMNDDDFFEYDEMSIEDSLGKRHSIPGMATLLPALRADYKDWCRRTGYWDVPKPNPTPIPAVE
jgi:hypothetical protein